MMGVKLKMQEIKMSVTNDPDEVLHRIRVKLIASNLPGSKDAYYALTANEAELTVEEVAAVMVKRGGFTGNYHDLVTHVKEFMSEIAYQLCDGFTVNAGYFSIHPAVGGLFRYKNEDPGSHPVQFRFRVRKPLRDLARYITVEVDAGADAGAIDNFIDVASGETNGRVTPGGIYTVTGRRIKVTGGSPECGVYFLSESDQRQFKAPVKFAVNLSAKVSGIVPPLPAGEYRIAIKTQYTIGGIDLKQPRTVTSGFSVKTGA
jgi:hypothetical protein